MAKEEKDVPLFTKNSPYLKDMKIEENAELETEIRKRLITRKDEHNKTIHQCVVCDKEGSRKVKMRQHVEIHLEGFSHKCQFCDVVKKTRGALQFHEYQYHTGPNA